MKTTPRNNKERYYKLNTVNKDNRGYTLIEMIIVMAIVMITLFFFITGINLLLSLPSRQCSRELRAAIEKVRIDTMGRNAAGLRIYRKTDGVYVQEVIFDKEGNTQLGEEQKIGRKRVVVDCTGDFTGKLNEAGVTLSFKRDTGGFYCKDDAHLVGTETAQYVSQFDVMSGGKTYRLSLAKLTGIVELKDVTYKL